MNKLLIDVSVLKSDRYVIGFWASDAELISAGARFHIEPESEETKTLTRDCDVHFIAEDKTPEISFYSVPAVEIIAFDSLGGYIALYGEAEEVIYIDKEQNVFYLAEDMNAFLADAANWREICQPFDEIEIFPSKEAAAEKYEFLNAEELMKKFPPVN